MRERAREEIRGMEKVNEVCRDRDTRKPFVVTTPMEESFLVK